MMTVIMERVMEKAKSRRVQTKLIDVAYISPVLSQTKSSSTPIVEIQAFKSCSILCHYDCSLLLHSICGLTSNKLTGFDTGPSPRMLEAYTLTVILVEVEHVDKEILDKWLQIPSSQEEAGMVAEPQLLPELESK